jgi:GNAT superfamily N-acetyltransferase
VSVDLNLASCECDTVLTDGRSIHLRPIRPDDGPRLQVFHSSLSPESVYLRFFGCHPWLSPPEVERFTHVDGVDRMALVAIRHDDIIGVARYDRLRSRPTEAEVALVVSDSHQGRGLGTCLLQHLAAYARSRRIDTLVAETLPQNRPMLEVFRHAGFAETARLHDGVVEVRLDIHSSRRCSSGDGPR